MGFVLVVSLVVYFRLGGDLISLIWTDRINKSFVGVRGAGVESQPLHKTHVLKQLSQNKWMTGYIAEIGVYGEL